MSRSFGVSSAVLAALLIGGCGGGSDPPPANFDIAAAVAGIARANERFLLNGALLNMPATLEAVHSALPDADFPGFGVLNRFRRTATISVAGIVESAYEDDYADLAMRTFYGMIDSEGNRAVSTARAAYPATGTIGNSGLLYDATYYDQASTAVGRTHVYWSLEPVPGDPNAAYLCVNIDFLNLSGVAGGDREHDCYRIASNGDRLGMRVTLVSPSTFGTAVFE